MRARLLKRDDAARSSHLHTMRTTVYDDHAHTQKRANTQLLAGLDCAALRKIAAARDYFTHCLDLHTRTRHCTVYSMDEPLQQAKFYAWLWSGLFLSLSRSLNCTNALGGAKRKLCPLRAVPHAALSLSCSKSAGANCDAAQVVVLASAAPALRRLCVRE